MYKRQKPGHIVLYSVLWIVLLICGCSKGPDFVRSYGKTVTETRPLKGIRSFMAGEKFRIYITQDSSKPESISITYGSNLMKGISTVMEGTDLTIKDDNNYNWVRNLDVFPLCTLNVHKLEKIVAMGASRIHSLDTLTESGLEFIMMGVESHSILIHAAQVTGRCSNTGNVTFQGWGGLLTWSCENGGWINASEMQSDDAYIYHYTDRDVFVNPGIILKAYVYGKGNVYYYREPSLVFEKQEFGSGKLIKK